MKVRRSTVLRLLLVLAALVVMIAPLANAFQSDLVGKDNSQFVREQRCDCHYPTQSDNISVTLKVPEQASIGAAQKPVRVEVGIQAPVGEGIAFGLLLNGTNMTDVRWEPSSFVGDGGISPAQVKINATVAFNTMPLLITRNFNATFMPGFVNQTINVTLIGMRTNHDGNVSGDFWTVRTTSIEVRKQRFVRLNVTVRNDELVSVSNVRVDFYVDDVYVGASTVQTIEGDARVNASVDWDATFAKDGWHEMRAVIDPMGNFTELDRGNNEITGRIWLGPVPEEEDRSLLYLAVAIIIVVVAVVGGFWYYRQRIYKL